MLEIENEIVRASCEYSLWFLKAADVKNLDSKNFTGELLTFHPLEHRILNNLKQVPGYQKAAHNILVSGGVDSMALLAVFSQLRSYFKGGLRVIHFHHGESGRPDQVGFRHQAEQIVRKYALSCGLECVVFKSEQSLRSEADFREFRRAHLKSIEGVLVTGHQRNDVLETQLLKLIRGGSGLSLAAFRMWNGRVFRPFLECTKTELVEYARVKKLPLVEDPSNFQSEALRNWLRNDWIPQLDKRQKGASKSLAQSLSRLVEEAQCNLSSLSSFEQSPVVQRTQFRKLTRFEARSFLFKYLKAQFPEDSFSQGYVEEVQKHLDKPQSVHTFTIGSFEWIVNAEQFSVRKRG